MIYVLIIIYIQRMFNRLTISIYSKNYNASALEDLLFIVCLQSLAFLFTSVNRKANYSKQKG